MSASEARPDNRPAERHALKEGLRILSFDGGGPGSYSQLLLLKEIIRRLEWDNVNKGDIDSDEELDFDEGALCPADYFDMMGGVGFGAYCALMLGRLRLTIDKALTELIKLAHTMFPNTPNEILTPDANLNRLKEEVENMLQRNGFPVDMPLKGKIGKGPQCKVIIYIQAASMPGDCTPFRTYPSRSNSSPQCTFVEAACAALTELPDWSPVEIGLGGLEIQYAGIPLGVNNPTRKMLHEALMAFGEQKHVSLILSLGAGKKSAPSIRSHTAFDNHRITLLSRFATDSERVNDELVQQLSDVGLFLRLDVDRGLEDMKTSDWYRLSIVGAHTRSYLRNESINTGIDKALRSLRTEDHLTFAQLNGATCHAVSKAPIERMFNRLERDVKDMRDVVVRSIEKITIIDAIGNRTSIPLEYCVTYEMLHDMVKFYFKHQKAPGHGFVDKGDYKLVYGEDRRKIRSAEWTYLQAPDLTLEMSMVLVKVLEDNRVQCPKCNQVFRGEGKNGWAICSNRTCKMRYQYQAERGTSWPTSAYKMLEDNAPIGKDNGSPISQAETNEGASQFRLISVVHKSPVIMYDVRSILRLLFISFDQGALFGMYRIELG